MEKSALPLTCILAYILEKHANLWSMQQEVIITLICCGAHWYMSLLKKSREAHSTETNSDYICAGICAFTSPADNSVVNELKSYYKTYVTW